MNRRTFLRSCAAFAAYPLLPAGLSLADEPAPMLLLEAREADIALLGADGPMTTVWSFNGMVPGPEIRVPVGSEIKARLINRLPQPMAIRWHGIAAIHKEEALANVITPSNVAPGESFDYALSAARPGTYWYYSGHRHESQFSKGLYGAIIVEGDGLTECRDVALMLDEWPVRGSPTSVTGASSEVPAESDGPDGSRQITVNGLANPVIPLRAGEAVRLRLINAASGRAFSLSLPGLECTALALDGVALVPPRPVGADLTIAPGQRVDLFAMVPSVAGTALDLRADRNGTSDQPVVSFPIQESEAPLITGRTSLDAPEMPALSLAESIDVDLRLRTGQLSASGPDQMGSEDPAEEGAVSAFNGAVGAAEMPLFQVPKGRTVVLNLVNDSLEKQVFHVYGFHFNVLEGGSPLEQGAWRDTLMVPPMGLAKIAFQAERRGNWLLSSHLLEDETGFDEGWFRVG